MPEFEVANPGEALALTAQVPKHGRKSTGAKSNGNGKGDLGFEATLWAAADKLRGNMDSSEYKHVVLGLIFLKYVSDAFEEKHEMILQEVSDPLSGMYLAEERMRYDAVEERDEYLADNVFWVPVEARWSMLQAKAKLPEIGTVLDDAMAAIERDNPRLTGVLPKDYARPSLDKRRLGELIDLVSGIGLGDRANRSKDILGRVYEYFLGQFASSEGKKGGEFYTPRPVVQLLVEMLEPKPGKRIFDPCCGSGGMFVQSEKFVEEHGGRLGDVSIYGQESNATTWRMCQMNLAIRGIEGRIEREDSFFSDRFKDLKADYIIANPPFNVSDWGGEGLRDDVRWKYGKPPVGNANFAWVQHFIHHLSPTGTAGFVLANGSLSSNTGGEGQIRTAVVEDDIVDCIVALPGQLFYTTPISVCLWFLSRKKEGPGTRDRRGDTLFIDARSLGALRDRTHRELGDHDISLIARQYHAWRGDMDAGPYSDIPGLCKVASMEDIRGHRYVLSPARYVGSENASDQDEPFKPKVRRLLAELDAEFAAGARLEILVGARLAGLRID
jgi:type I restriction enzyme M protein